MTKTKDEVLQEIFDNDPMGILDGNVETKPMPDDWWNHGINPILGYKYKKPGDGKRTRDKFEYPKEENYNPNTD